MKSKNTNNYAPIVLVVYNRLSLTQGTIESLAMNRGAVNSKLYIYSDAPKGPGDYDSVAAVRQYVKGVRGFQEVHVVERPYNFGLAKNVIESITEIIGIYGKVIFMEDDHLLSEYFLDYINEGLALYENDPSVASINGYLPSIKLSEERESATYVSTFFLRGADCWGWGTWERAWKKFEPSAELLYSKIRWCPDLYRFNIKNTCNYLGMLKANAMNLNNSWMVRWYAATFLEDMYTLYPTRSLVRNTGVDGSGTHFSVQTSIYETELTLNPVCLTRIPVRDAEDALDALALFNTESKIRQPIYRFYFTRIVPIWLHKTLRRMLRIF